MDDSYPICRRCRTPVVKYRAEYLTFEGMHWSCFHHEYEHVRSSRDPRIANVLNPAFLDPDVACRDPACPARAFDGNPIPSWLEERELPG